MPSRPSRAPLDPYGIYGTRTANRLSASRRRRRSQNIVVLLCLIGLVGLGIVFLNWRRVETDVADAYIETGLQANASLVWVQSKNSNAQTLLIAGRDGRLMRVDNADGAAQKTVLLENDFPLRTPRVVGDKIFVPGEGGVLSAVSWQNKRLLWRVRFDDSLTAQPAVFQITRSIAASPSAPPPDPVTSTGASSADAAIPVVPVPPKVSRKQVVVAGSDAGLVMAIDVGSGKPMWRVRLPAPIGDGLAAVEANGRARVLVPLLGGNGMRGGVWCLDGATGKVLWRFPKDARVEAIQFSAPIGDLAGNRAYIANDLGTIVALNLTTGMYDARRAIGWKTFLRPLGKKDSPQMLLMRATPLLVRWPKSQGNGAEGSGTGREDALIVGGNDGSVRGFSARNGSPLWQFSTSGPILSLTNVRGADGRQLVLAVSRSSHPVLLDAANGSVERRLTGRGAVFTGATVSDQHIFAMTETGTIHRFALSN